MRVNIVSNFSPNTGLNQDSLVLRGILAHAFGENVKIGKVHHLLPQCGSAAANIFLEVVNPSLFSYAKKNIWIPNIECTWKSWEPYVKMFDEIWCKTHEAYDLFSMLAEGSNTRVQYIKWTSIDKVTATKKDYNKAIVLVGKNVYRNPKQLLRAYADIHDDDPAFYANLPVLHIPHNPNHITVYVPPQLSDKVILLNRELTDEEYTALLHDCGLAICTSATEGYGHAINEAMSAGCNLMLSHIRPFTEDLALGVPVHWMTHSQVIEHPTCFGQIADVDIQSVITQLRNYTDSTRYQRVERMVASRKEYERRHSDFVRIAEEIVRAAIPDVEYSLNLPAENTLPDVSIVTLTRDRRVFMPLAKYSYMIQSYPEDKLEWVIVDDGNDPIEDTLIGVPNVKYVRVDTQLSIGEKRNIGVQNAMYDTIMFMDDDDVYPNNSVLERVAMMYMDPAKQCVFATTIPCYDICKFASFINIPPSSLGMSERVSEASLGFTRAFWNECNFAHVQIGEGNTFIRGREHMCREVSPQEVIVSLVHTRNTSSRKLPDNKEPNGCHYGFNEKLFELVTQIGQELAQSVESTPASSLNPVLPNDKI